LLQICTAQKLRSNILARTGNTGNGEKQKQINFQRYMILMIDYFYNGSQIIFIIQLIDIIARLEAIVGLLILIILISPLLIRYLYLGA